MANELKGRSLLTLLDFSQREIREILNLSHQVKAERQAGKRHRRFTGYSLAMLFEKRSTRTRSAFETAFGEEGGHPVFLSQQDIQLGAKETLEDTARVLGRMFDIIEFRGFEQRTVEILAEHSGVPVVNGLTDVYHPTQALADIMTLEEHTGSLREASLCFVGDGRNNVANSLMIICAKTGVDYSVACPKDLSPAPEFLEIGKSLADESGSSVNVYHDVNDLPTDANAVYTDVWVSMGEEDKKAERRATLLPFQVTSELMDRFSDAIFLHCLPAVRGNEMTADVIDGPRSQVWEQAENRKHTIKATMLALLGLA